MRLNGLLAGFLAASLAGASLAQDLPAGDAPVAADASPGTDAPAADPGPLTRPDVEAWLDGYLPYALERGDIAGAVVVVVKDGQVLLEKGYGYADVAARKPVDPETTLFRPGSVSKLFTWTAVMQLVEQGKIDLDQDVNAYLDFEIPPYAGQPITMRNIMTHTTGMEEQVRALITAKPEEVTSLETALKHWVPERVFAPGSTPAYSNYATALAGYIIERVSGQPFDDYVDQHLFEPLGMAHSSFRQPLPPELLLNMSKGYARGSDDKDQPYEFISLAPAGSLAATGADMGKFMIAHLQDGALGGARILRADTAEQMHSTAHTVLPLVNRMLLGFYETNANGHRGISHGGDTQWFHSNLHLFPDDGIGLFVSMNSAGREGASGVIRGELFDRFVDRYLPGPGPGGEGVDAETAKLHAQQAAGLYDVSRRSESNFLSFAYLLGQAKVVANADGTITVPSVLGTNGVPKKWKEISPYVWQDVFGDDRITVDVVDGQVVRFAVEPYSAFMVFDRTPWWKASSWLLPALVVGLVALALTVLAWPVSAMVRRHYGVGLNLPARELRTLRATRWSALAVFAMAAFSMGLVVMMLSSLELLSPANDGLIRVMRVLSMLVFPLGALALAWAAFRTWTSSRRFLAKLWSTVLALSGLVVLWVAAVFHLFGYSALY